MRKRTEPTRLYSIIFKRVFLVSILVMVLGLFIAFFSLIRLFVTEIGTARLDILRQIASLNQVVKSVTTSVTDDLYASIRLAQPLEQEEMYDLTKHAIITAQSTFDRYQMDASVDVVFGDGTIRFSSDQGQREPLNQLLSSYWFINLTAGKADRSWNLRFLQSEESGSAVLSYGRVLRDAAGEPICVVIANTAQNMVYKSYSDALRNDNRMYIVDEDGIIVSHSNQSLVGFALYHMNEEAQTLRSGTSTIQSRRGGQVLVTNYYDSRTGWTIIEELQIGAIIRSYQSAIVLAVVIVAAAILLALLLSYVTARMITKPLLLLAARMQRIHSDCLELMPMQSQYYEVQVLSQTFNTMIGRIRRLIGEIKSEEAEKRSIEFDFLQAQINPHFLHNTLLGIKSLVVLGQQERATTMLDAFMGLLKMPIEADRKSHALREEIEYVRRYITIMECRYGLEFPLTVYVEEGLENFRVPQLILQPLIENAIFHGISEMDGAGCLTITAQHSGENILLRVEDNGDGMTAQQIAALWNADRAPRRSSLNSISLRNVRSRIQYVFGPLSRIEIESTPGHGTVISIVIVPRKEEPS